MPIPVSLLPHNFYRSQVRILDSRGAVCALNASRLPPGTSGFGACMQGADVGLFEPPGKREYIIEALILALELSTCALMATLEGALREIQ